jgi:cytoskeletal protein CcmA (bactofilin family)
MQKPIEPTAEDSGEAAPPAGRPESSTFIDEGAEFEGTLRLTGTFRIDAEFRGQIESDGTVIVGEGAGIQAHLKAREVIVAGAVVGDVEASRLLVLRSGARLHGQVDTPCLEVERGAVFNGSTRMTRPEQEVRKGAAAAKSAKSEPAAKPTATATPPAQA